MKQILVVDGCLQKLESGKSQSLELSCFSFSGEMEKFNVVLEMFWEFAGREKIPGFPLVQLLYLNFHCYCRS